MSQCSFSTNYRFSWQCSQPVCSLVLTRGSIILFFLHQPVYTKPFPFLNLSWSGCGHKKGWTHLRKGQSSASQVTPEVQDTEVHFPPGPSFPIFCKPKEREDEPQWKHKKSKEAAALWLPPSAASSLDTLPQIPLHHAPRPQQRKSSS